MYNKVKKVLTNMGYVYEECEGMENRNGFMLSEGFKVKTSDNATIYIEIDKDGDIDLWDALTGIHCFTIEKKNHI